MMRRRRFGLTTALIAGTPFAMLAVQSYGGEGMLRIYLFSLPATALLVAEAGVALASVRGLRLGVIIVALCTLPTSLVARYGNESYERSTPNEAAAVAVLYRIAPRGSTLVSLSPNLSWQYRGLAEYAYPPSAVDESDFRRVDVAVRRVPKNPHGSYLLVTRSQIAYGEQVYGLPAGWEAVVRHDIAATNRFTVVYRNPEATIYRLNPVKPVRKAPRTAR
jgi:hypothetical protein